MRIAFISDLHSSLNALDTVLDDCKKRGADRIFCLGDVVDLGPEPEQVVQRLCELKIPTIKGNHDTLDEHPPAPFLRELEDWTKTQLTAASTTWLKNLPASLFEEFGHARLLMVHGSPHSNTEGLLAETPAEKINQWLNESGANILLAGHTHVPLVRHVSAGTAINVGSTSIPFAEANVIPPIGLPFSDYVILDIRDGATSVEQIRIPMDFEALAKAVKHADMPYAETFLSTWQSPTN
jgi:putative phosphoesterase